MATLTKRPSGYQAKVFLGGKRRAKTFTRFSNAKRWAVQLESGHAAGIAESPRLPLSHFIKLHSEHLSKAHRRPRHECTVIGTFLDDPIAQIPIGKVTPQAGYAFSVQSRRVTTVTNARRDNKPTTKFTLPPRL